MTRETSTYCKAQPVAVASMTNQLDSTQPEAYLNQVQTSRHQIHWLDLQQSSAMQAWPYITDKSKALALLHQGA